jgi:hypothetical protein
MEEEGGKVGVSSRKLGTNQNVRVDTLKVTCTCRNFNNLEENIFISWFLKYALWEPWLVTVRSIGNGSEAVILSMKQGKSILVTRPIFPLECVQGSRLDPLTSYSERDKKFTSDKVKL